MIANSACVALKTRQSKKRAKRGRKRPVARRSKTGLRAVSKTAKPSISGAEIRARIAANREKRLRIADAMKREAGVTGHEINTENLAGLAYIGTGRILSPEGRKIVQLYTLAHECGHIFLHNSGPGYWLPGHIKELEAESYAHQAFREHGMTLPRRLSDWGRMYVGSWVEKDRAAGIPIDPRAVAYASGRRSPYAPLRMVPSTWTMFRAEETPPLPSKPEAALAQAGFQAAAARRSWLHRLLGRVPRRVMEEAGAVARLALGWMLHGTTVCWFLVGLLHAFYPHLFARPPGLYHPTSAELMIAATGGLLLANLAVLWRTTTR